jgi:hypothetical protein
LVASLPIGWASPVERELSWRDVLEPLAVVSAAALGGYGGTPERADTTAPH